MHHAEFSKTFSFSIKSLEKAKNQDGYHFNVHFGKLMKTHLNPFCNHHTVLTIATLRIMGIVLVNTYTYNNLLWMIAPPCFYVLEAQSDYFRQYDQSHTDNK